MSPHRCWVTTALLGGVLGLGCSSTTTAILLTVGTTGTSSAGSTSSGTTSATSGTSGTSGTASTTTSGSSTSASTSGSGTSSTGSSGTSSGTTGTSGGAPCTDSLACGAGDYCNTSVPDGACCPTIGSALSVDGVTGIDGPCCGAIGVSACLTIGQAMSNVVAAGQSSVTLEVTSSQPDWAPAESWPIVLSHGVTVHAPDLYFSGSGNADLFVVTPASAADILAVTIQGDLNHPANIGLSSAYTASQTAHALTVANNGSLVVQDVWVGGQVGIEVGSPGASAGRLTLGPDPVVVGSLDHSLLGTVGISCQGQNASVQSSISDTAGSSSTSTPVLQVQAQSQEDFLVGDFCNVSLTQSPSLGPTPVAGICPPAPRRDQVGLSVLGASVVSLTNASVQCQAKDGIDLAAGDSSGTPTLTLTSVTLQHNGCNGLQTQGGTANFFGTSVITSNHYGVVADNGSVTLGGSLGVTPTTIACNTATEPGACQSDPNSVDVWQQGSGNVDADFVTWANAAPPLVYSCNPALTACTWNDGTPESGPLPAGAELVVSTQATGLVTTLVATSANGVCP